MEAGKDIKEKKWKKVEGRKEDRIGGLGIAKEVPHQERQDRDVQQSDVTPRRVA